MNFLKHQNIAKSIIRISLGLTFILSGFLILQDIDPWISLVQPWVEELLPFSVRTALLITAFYDVAQGVWLITGIYPTIASFFALLHMVQVLVVAGVNWVTYRDIGILGMSIALFIENYSHRAEDG